MNFQNKTNQAYAPSTAITQVPGIIIATRDPNSYDTQYPIGQFWVNKSAENLFYLNSQNTNSGFLQSQWISVVSAIETISDTANVVVLPSGKFDVPPENIQLTCLDGSVSINSDPANHRIEFSATEQFQWQVVTLDQTLAKSRGYFADGLLKLNFTLPLTSNVGDTYQVCAKSAVGFQIVQSAGQYVQVGDKITTVGALGSINSTAIGDWITLVCMEANLGWSAKVEQGVLVVA